ncbi:hypothetical protein TREMEDRAFT_33244 [Tremella mesenterica DSM 1558]|uniref:uncharacterized protein n=1 Tax=Tremella mesenterica (strain ATCC 24925 / CBS 8224 / DSM 1558 / NBRC 9311 / NRRL Y-6157 / RJB 2259-6 / UBC 559-6) TaxID=578456 RepID=UPI0003F498CA|nr:uncharacterized protein TREMEDRAFT_33244 [Tremella mesenterica DSM 1558]EIW67561.1 hypothetical protein TREMEDRAFT_33244 [Tremella mesenterica DSM 1558]
MFKLLKDLTRAPEPLSRPPIQTSQDSSSLTPPYVPRVRANSRSVPSVVQQSSTTSNRDDEVPPSRSNPGIVTNINDEVSSGSDTNKEGIKISRNGKQKQMQDQEQEEKSEDGKRVVGLLNELKVGNGIMDYVEVMSFIMQSMSTRRANRGLSQLLSIPPNSHSRGAFRRHDGFQTLFIVFIKGLSWKESSKGMTEEEKQVEEVQRWEGVRLGFEVLSWAQDREGTKFFESQGGYLSLLPSLYTLVPPSIPTPSSSSGPSIQPHRNDSRGPNGKVLSYLLAHILNNNYALLSLSLSDPCPNYGELYLRWPRALPLLWSYLWTQPLSHSSTLVSDKPDGCDQDEQYTLITHGHFETSNQPSDNHAKLVLRFFQILLQIIQSSTANLLSVHTHLPRLAEFLLIRLYGPDIPRKYDVTFPPRAEWHEGVTSPVLVEWKPPSEELRGIYLELLRRMLDAGVSQEITWRLFTLVKTQQEFNSGLSTSTTGVNGKSELSSTKLNNIKVPVAMKGKEKEKGKMKSRNGPLPHLTILPLEGAQKETLRYEVLQLIKDSIRARPPNAFVFRPGERGGLILRDLGKTWVTSQKGFNFSCWIQITKLNGPLTLLHISQSSHTLLKIRILENSQIGITTHSHSHSHPPPPPHPPPHPTHSENHEEEEEEGEEIVCPAPDALIPHNQYTHFSLNMRKSRSGEYSEVRLYIHGVRVGSMKVRFPIVSSMPSKGHDGKLHVKEGRIRVVVGGEGRERKMKREMRRGKEMREEENEWMLARALLLEDAIPEDLILLMYHLGPRYTGNFQEPLGKFLTYEGAAAINIYISSQAQTSEDKRMFTSPVNSILVRAIRQGPAIPEENILLSVCAKDILHAHHSSKITCPLVDTCINAAMPHPARAKQVRHGLIHLQGNVFPSVTMCLDEAVGMVGGGIVVLKMIDMAQNSEELADSLGILRDMIRSSWAASEEMERIHGFELLAALLRPKMLNMVDVQCTKIILSMLGINMDRPAIATVHNSVAYRTIGLEFELWSLAPLGITSLYLQHFEYLLSTSRHARYNLLRTFQRSSMIKKLLHTLRSNYFDPAVIPVVVDTLRLVLSARWSSEDSIKPVFSYLVSGLCQQNTGFLDPSIEPLPSQQAPSLILNMMAQLLHTPQRLIKLNKSIALHRLLVVFISSNSTYYVIIPCLDILEKSMTTKGMETFQRSFESEGGFALLARTLPSIWRKDIQEYVLRMMLGPEDNREGKNVLACPQLLSCVMSTLEILLQVGGEEDSPTRPMNSRTRSGTVTSLRSVRMSPIITTDTRPESSSLFDLLTELTTIYRTSHPFRRNLTGRRVETMLPSLAEFAAVSASGPSQIVSPQRAAARAWLLALIEMSKLPRSLITQMNLIVEQLGSPLQSSSSYVPQSPLASPSSIYSATSPRQTSMSGSYFGSPLSGKGFTPSSPGLRRRPSTDAGLTMTRQRSYGDKREKRTPLKRVLTNESVLEGGRDKNAAWKMIIIQTDAQTHAKSTIERKEYWTRISSQDWPRHAAALRTENGLWPDDIGPAPWRLDGSEGPLRMRNRLERVNAIPEQGTTRGKSKLRDAIPSVDELSSAVSRINVAPWEDPFALALGQAAVIAEEGESGSSPSLSSR